MEVVPKTVIADHVADSDFESFLQRAFEEAGGKDIHIHVETAGHGSTPRYNIHLVQINPAEYGFEVPASRRLVDSNQTTPENAAGYFRQLHDMFRTSSLEKFEAIARQDLTRDYNNWTVFVRVTE